MKSKKPSKEKLEDHLRAGATIASIAKKYGASVQSVHNWIKAYGLVGIYGVKKPKDEPAAIPARESVPEGMTLIAEIGLNPSNAITVNTSASSSKEPIHHAPPTDPTWTPIITEVEQSHTDAKLQELPTTSEVPVVPVVEMAEPEMKIFICLDCGEKFFSEEYASLCDACYKSLGDHEPIPSEDDPVTPGTCEEVWQGVLDDLKSIRRVYLTEAEKSFDERFRALCAEVWG